MRCLAVNRGCEMSSGDVEVSESADVVVEKASVKDGRVVGKGTWSSTAMGRPKCALEKEDNVGAM